MSVLIFTAKLGEDPILTDVFRVGGSASTVQDNSSTMLDKLQQNKSNDRPHTQKNGLRKEDASNMILNTRNSDPDNDLV